MAYDYVPCDRDQLFLMSMSMREWVDEGHLAWFVIELVERVDTSGFDARHPNDGPGRPAYNPRMMLGLLFYGYQTGVRSSRRIEANCRTDAAYRVICGNATPDHATIARFLVDHEAAIEGVFIDVLRLCVAAGLVAVDTIAIDGTKIGSDAALDTNRTRAWIEAEVQQMLAEAAAADTAEDAQPELFGGELPAPLATRSGRLARLEAALAEIEAQDAAERAEAAERAAKAAAEAAEGRKVRGRKPKDPHAALARAETDEAAVRVRAQRETAKNGGIPPDEHPDVVTAVAATAEARVAAEAAEPTPHKANTTDPESRILKTRTGWVQGYNAQAAVNENQIIVACAITQDINDVGQYQPMVEATISALTAAGVTDPVGTILADAGYWSEDNATAQGPNRLIATLKDHKQRRAARDLGTTTGPPPPDASAIDAMEHRLRTPAGAATYATRSHTVEPVFSVKTNHHYDRFRRRGLRAATSEWALIATTHNLGKLFRHDPLGVT
jgi:transposase